MPDKKWCSEAAYSIEIPLENSDTGKLKSYEDSQRISIIPDKIVNGYANPERPRELYRGLCNKEQAKYNLTMEEFLEEMTRLSNDTELSKSRFLNTPLLLYKHFYKEDKTPCILYGTDSIDKDRSWGIFYSYRRESQRDFTRRI
ncbi:MAG: hypothetical protein CSA89_00670 [Bacteroidales bacterium]|nr:MAG: hypothetical protein CSA89_00670 [Bacteroidales bacterium]